MKNYKFTVKNLDCANCAKRIEDKISSYDEYKNVALNFATLKLSFDTEKEKNVKQDIQKIIDSIEPKVKVLDNDSIEEEEEIGSIKNNLIRLIIRNINILFIYGI